MSVIINIDKKEIVVPFAKSEVESKLKYLYANSKFFKSFDDSNNLLGYYKYDFSFETQVQITLSESDENKTKVTIQIIGEKPSYDKVSYNDVISRMTHVLQTDTDTLEAEIPVKKKSGCLKYFLIGVGIFVLLNAIIALIAARI